MPKSFKSKVVALDVLEARNIASECVDALKRGTDTLYAYKITQLSKNNFCIEFSFISQKTIEFPQ